MDQRERKEEQADLRRCARAMQSAAISAGKEGETGRPPPEALRVSVTPTPCSCFCLLGL